MEIIESFTKCTREDPVALSIGVFDGVHLGHQSLIQHLNNHKVIITFKNHPKAWILKTPTRNIHPFHQRVEYLSLQHIDTLYALEFKEEIRTLTAKAFLEKCANILNLQTLVLGHDTAIGSDRISDPNLLKKYVPKIIEVPPLIQDGVIISSQRIRDAISKGDFKHASKWLGKPYQLKLENERFNQETLELDAADLTLPPTGTWAITLNGRRARIQVTPDRKIKLENDFNVVEAQTVLFFEIGWD